MEGRESESHSSRVNASAITHLFIIFNLCRMELSLSLSVCVWLVKSDSVGAIGWSPEAHRNTSEMTDWIMMYREENVSKDMP